MELLGASHEQHGKCEIQQCLVRCISAAALSIEDGWSADDRTGVCGEKMRIFPTRTVWLTSVVLLNLYARCLAINLSLVVEAC